MLKPNLVEYEAGTAINTHPVVVAGAATAFRRAGALEVIVGEGPGHRRDIEYLLTSTGMLDHLRDDRLTFVDLNQDDVREVPLRSRFTGLERLALPVELLRSDFIVSMPKLKTHHWAGLTASMKNFFGAVPGAVYGWPKNILHVHGIPNSILDLNATIRPHFAILDAVTAMEGDGPIMGTPAAAGICRDEPRPSGARRDCGTGHRAEPGQAGVLQPGRAFSRQYRRSRDRTAWRAVVEVRDDIRRGRGLQTDAVECVVTAHRRSQHSRKSCCALGPQVLTCGRSAVCTIP